MNYNLTKKRLAMRILLAFILINTSVSFLYARNAYGQTTLKKNDISYSVTNESIQNVFTQLSKLTGFYFFYDESVVENIENVSLNVKSKDIDAILKTLTEETALTFKKVDNTISVNRNSKKATTIQAVNQNQKKISGIVKDIHGETIIGASVVVKGTSNNGTITDFDGNFNLEVPDNAVVIISYIGYITQEVKVGSTTTLNILLQEDVQNLDEVVVVGYGTQKKVNLTGAIGIADGDVMENRPIGNIAQGLQGVVPNLNISFDSGSPTAKTTFNVRGATSLNGGTALLLVDGVETSDLSLLNPQDIESVSVLKDASSAAVYGARAAFGVVLITTKKGKKGQKVQINYNNNFSWSAPSRLPDGVSSDKWVRAINQAGINDGSGAYFNAKQVDAIDAFIKDPTNNPSAFLDANGDYTAKGQWAYAGNTDWFDTLYKDAAFMHQHNASISGGTEKNTYYGSIGLKDQDGLLAYGSDNYKRINMAFNFTSDVTKWLEIGFRAKYNRSESDSPNTHYYMGSSPYYEVYRAFPFIPVTLPNGEFAGVEGSNFNYNIAGILDQAGRSTVGADDIWYTGSFHLKPLEGLSVKGDYTGNKYFKQTRDHQKTLYQSMPNPSDTPLAKGSPNGVKQDKYNDTYQALNVWAEYKKTFNQKHSLGAMVGYNQESKSITSLKIESSNLFANDFPMNDLATTFKSVEESATIWAVQGGFFRLNYDYMQKYLIELNGRYDGSSKYNSDSRWGFFPSVSAAWRVSEENFFEPARDLFDNLKIRGSIGALGNQVTDGNFQYLGYLSGTSLNYLMGGNILTGLKPSTLASPNISWEKVITTNVGLDFTILKNRLNASVDYYIRNTNGMVVSKAYPGVLGTSGGKENLADMRTNGWELSLTWNDNIESVGGSPMDYSIGIGLSDNKSTITNYNNPTGSLADNYEGKELGEIWGYVTDGFIMTEEEALKMSTVQSFISKTWIPGDIRYTDLNGDNVIDKGDNTLANSGDRKVIGNTTPRYNFNINASVSWKGFDLRAFFEGTAKRDIWMDSSVFWGYDGVWGSAINDYHIDNSWTTTNTDAYYPIATWSKRSKETQTKYLQNGAYIRLKDLSLSYTIPQKIVTNLGISQLRVFASGQNLWEGTKLFEFLDPDTTGKRKSNGDLDTDGKVYPFSRSYSFGINLTF